MSSSSDQPRPTLADYVALGLTPALIMALIISLVFFLADVFYQGAYHERLLWTLFFFVVGAVGIARVSMMGDIASRAWLYGLILGGLVWIALQTFVEYPEDSPAAGARALINLFLIGVVWWCAHRLTWDCTNVDDRTDISGEGLLQTAGLDTDVRPEKKDDEEAPDEGEKAATWLERYRRYRERQQKKRAMGVWVIYFSLAALPLFGLGQAFIDPDEVERRRSAFWLMTIYVGSGLGLLLTTCFLSLRRYLRQRKLQMPVAMTGAWLMLGGTLVALMLVAGALLPRPWPEYPWFNWTPFRNSDDQQASPWALKEDSPAKDAGPGGKDREDKEAQQGGGKKDKPEQDAGKDRSGGKDKDGKDAGAKKDRKEASGKDGGSKSRQGRKRSGDSSTSKPSGSWSFLDFLRPWLKWITIILIVLVVLFVLIRGGLGWLANFSDWARRVLELFRNLWASLFGRRLGSDDNEEQETTERIVSKQPFSSFADPFESGAAGRWTARQLVQYTFAALEAWARERDLARQEGETPLEFCRRLGDDVPAMADDLTRLANLFARAAYAPGAMPANAADVVRAFWEQLRESVSV
jgi:hypothetical protein